MNRKYELLRKIQKADFAMTELVLFLNNQPDCPQAKELYEDARNVYMKARKEYTENYGPLIHSDITTEKDHCSWIRGPWPWEGEV